MSPQKEIETLLVSLYGEVKKEDSDEGDLFTLPKGLSCLILAAQIEPLLKGSGVDLSMTSSECETRVFLRRNPVRD